MCVCICMYVQGNRLLLNSFNILINFIIIFFCNAFLIYFYCYHKGANNPEILTAPNTEMLRVKRFWVKWSQSGLGTKFPGSLLLDSQEPAEQYGIGNVL